MRAQIAGIGTCLLLAAASTTAAQGRGRSAALAQDRLRLSVNVGQQVSEQPFKQALTFQQYLEQGDLALERTIPKKLFVDGGAAIRVLRGLHAGVAFSTFRANGSGTVSAHVPHPFFFGQLRSTTGEIAGINRTETAAHIQVSWTVPTAHGLEFSPFAGPTIFQVEQVFTTKLNLTLANEVFPYDTLAFPGVSTEVLKDHMNGYNAGIDMTWRLSRTVGVGALIRYSHGSKHFTPTGGQSTTVEVGGLHAGGGLRVIF